MAYEGISRIINFDQLEAFDPEKYKIGKHIATGTYGEVHEATDVANDNKKVAIKIVENIKQNIEEIEQEYLVLRKVGVASNLPQFHGVFIRKEGSPEEHQILFVIELVSNGSVSDLARLMKKANKRLSERVISYILGETIVALKNLHQMHIIHRDVKGPNVLITDEGKIKLVDFGQCAHLNSTMGKRKTSVGTPYWMAPEVIEAEAKDDVDYDLRCDTWALGIMAIELADGEPPLAALHPMRALFQIVRNPPPTCTRISDWSNEFNDFVSECLVKNPDHRPLLAECEEHPFIELGKEKRNEIRDELKKMVESIKDKDKSGKRPLIEAVSKMGYLKDERKAKPKKMVVDDLASLEQVTDDIVVKTLETRWKSNKIYTWLADVLISINPFSETHLYGAQIQEKYQSKSRSENDPHIYGVVDRAHQDMMHHKEHQTIIMTGESGGGKSFNFTMSIKHLCHVGRTNPALLMKVNRSLVILDALGNAVTQLNPDATRHIRYFDVTFGKTGKITGAIIWILMLEKFRVSHTPKNEGNFHIFYQFYDGLSQTARLARYRLNVGRNYRYLAKNHYDNEVTNAAKFEEFEGALELFGISDRQKHALYLMLSAVLHIGNIEFDEGPAGVSIRNPEIVTEVSFLLDVDDKKLSWALCNYCRLVRDTVEPASKTLEQAQAHCDAFARMIYQRLVDFVINIMNNHFFLARQKFGDDNAIGVLDMFGFEANEVNTLDNLFVNIANEQMQFYYNQQVFTWEMQDYEAEGIPVRNFAFPDNRHILELFLTKSGGILSTLDEEARDDKGNDHSFSEMIHKRVQAKQFQKVSDTSFAIAHYVGRVKYDTRGFVDRNRDYINTELIQTMRKTPNEIIRSLFTSQLTRTGNLTVDKHSNKNATLKKNDSKRYNTKSKAKLSQSKHVQTLGLTFKFSLIELLHKMTHSTPHFVRCIRSNMDYSGSIFEVDMVKHQVKYHAVCDTIRIRQQGFSHRIRYQEFLRRYQFLSFEFDEKVDLTKDNARLLLVRLKMEGWAIGKNKVFLKYYNEEYLSRLYDTSVKKIIKIQAMMRSYMYMKKKFRSIKKAPTISQEEAAVKIQANIRGHLARQSNPQIMEKLEVRRKSRELIDEKTADTIASCQKFGESTIEAEAARYLQHYFRKWKMKSLFQALTYYRADKQLNLVYFSQQVHLYGQELQAKNLRNNKIMDLSRIRNEAIGSHFTILADRKKKIAPKLSLDHTLNAFFDTSYLCDPTKRRRADDDWDAPFRSKSPAFKARSQNMGMVDAFTNHGTTTPTPARTGQQDDYVPGDVRSRANLFAGGGGAGQSPNKPTSPSRFGGKKKIGTGFIQIPNNQPLPVYDKYGGSYINKKSAAPGPPITISSWENREVNGQDDDDGKQFDFRKNLRKGPHSAAILEMEKRAENHSSSDSPYNFQGMLRKTGKKDHLNAEQNTFRPASPEYDQFGAAIIPGSRSATPTFYEESDEAML